MSAILQALKKSQAHRQQLAPPAAPTTGFPPATGKNGARLWLVLGLLSAGMLIGYMLAASHGPEVATTPQAGKKSPASTRTARIETATDTPGAHKESAPPAATRSGREPIAPAGAGTDHVSVTTAMPANDNPPESRPATVEPENAKTPPATALSEPGGNDESSWSTLSPTHWYQLPATVREQAGTLKINVIHLADTPEHSWVLVNMKRYQMGDRLPGEFFLREIRAQALLLQRGDYLFELTVAD